MWKLVIEDDEAQRTVVPLTRDQYTMGRKEGNSIRLTERNVSRDHAQLVQAADTGLFTIEDLTSYNGVYVNGLRIGHTQELSHGDLIQIGDYRIVLHDDTVPDSPPSTVLATDSKSTLPMGARAAALLERPNRLVMLVGPTPGMEFPLERDRMSVGRAETCDISIVHNSVSRHHCDIHALSDGRFEIVDCDSANGVCVNAAELRRGIIEAGDVIELGDVRFKFVGRGQVFVPGSTESQQIATLGNREFEPAAVRKRMSPWVPFAVVLLVVLCASLAALAVVLLRR